VTRDSIDDLSQRVSRWIAVESLLFETLGRWARELREPALKRTMATWCHRHAWHADLWRARLPVIPHHEVGADGVEAWLAPLRTALDTVDEAADAVTVMFGPVLEALEQAVDEHRNAIDSRLDGPSARILELVSADLDRERADLTAR
jgi:hypothetical protein